ncbi:MAG: hypothetical protein H0U94_14120, partial [Acidobacteria bacterium]|nr:hypothetical protein [Acidobacteriota bacterium]
MIPVILTFVIILALVLGAYWAFVLRLDQADDAAIQKRLKPAETVVAAPQKFRILRPVERLSSVGQLNTVLERTGRITAPLQRDLTQAGLQVTVATVLLSAGCLALVGYFLVKLITFNTTMGIIAGLALSFVPFMF